VCVRKPDIGQVKKRIEGAEPDRTLCLLDRYRVVALPGTDDRTETERQRRRARQRERSVERAQLEARKQALAASVHASPHGDARLRELVAELLWFRSAVAKAGMVGAF